MGILNSPGKSDTTQVKEANKYCTNSLKAQMKEVISDGDGYMTIGQALATRLLNIALYAESNTDSLRAIKEIYDRTEGKAAVVKQDSTASIPKVVFALDAEEVEVLEEKVSKATSEDWENVFGEETYEECEPSSVGDLLK